MKKIFLILLACSVFSLGMGKKPAKEAVPAEKGNAAIQTEGSSKSAPQFTLKDLDGKDVSLKDFKDKKAVLLVFWATWCIYCVEEISDLIKLTEQYKGKELVIFGVNLEETTKKVAPFAKKNKINYSILFDEKGTVARAYEVQGLPANVLIDKKGNIIYSGSYSEELEKLIAATLKK
ncbi:MAG: TlpA disulfide reductase family protein [Candidatus Firestonebacteria bacterium]|nr:TlpA disulfide reductase family protein [Candidatus Firestonebacteria bacterium]